MKVVLNVPECRQQRATDCLLQGLHPGEGRRGAADHQGWDICVILTGAKNGAESFRDLPKATRLPGQTGLGQPAAEAERPVQQGVCRPCPPRAWSLGHLIRYRKRGRGHEALC